MCFTKRQTDTTIGPKHATLSGGWLGLRAEEGRGKPRYRLGEAHAALDPRIPEWDFLEYAPSRSGNPPNGSILVGGGKETKHGIPLVAASEEGEAQTEPAWETMRECRVIGPDYTLVRKVEVAWNGPPQKVKVP